MPELPEVEVVRRGLATHLSGRTFEAIEVLHPRPVRTHPVGAAGFVAELTGRQVLEPRRRGKYLWLAFNDGDALIAHLGMSGQFRFNAPDEPRHPHTRVIFTLDDGAQLRFVDQRMFGGLTLAPGGAELPVSHIARDPFDPEFDVAEVARQLRSKSTGVKRVLLNQRVVSGIGNIYADEALWRARIRFDRPANSLSQRSAVGLLSAAREVMEEALAQGGTSFDALYVNTSGEAGYFARELNVYGREGEPCPRCGSPIVREAFMNRSSFSCRRCQRSRVRPL